MYICIDPQSYKRDTVSHYITHVFVIRHVVYMWLSGYMYVCMHHTYIQMSKGLLQIQCTNPNSM